MASLEDIRNKLKAIEDRKGGGNRQTGPSINYPFWNIPVGSTAQVRFLPDGDQNNTFFWKERQLINLTFPGVVGRDDKRDVTVKVPCAEMFGGTCPVLKEIRPWWDKGKEMEDLARKYWIKRSYLFQGFVNDNPLEGDEAPENPIRKFIIGPQIFNIIKSALLDPDMENSPADYLCGTDFRITRTTKGKYNDYSTSSWARRETALTENQLAAIEQYGLYDLKDWLPANPDEEALNAIFEMFQASLEGELYDLDRWGKFYRPYGLTMDDDDSDDTVTQSKSATVKASETKKEETVAEVKTEAPKAETVEKKSVSSEDILQKIRERAAQR